MNIINVLNKLMKNQGLSLDKLAKLTGVSRSNINRMRTDPDCNPTIYTLLPIAKFFQISVEQLIGEQPITDSHKYQLDSLKLEKLPILRTYQEILNFVQYSTLPEHTDYTYVENLVSTISFAYVVQDNNMQPLFPPNIMVIFDPEKSATNHSFVLALDIHNKQVIFRQYLGGGELNSLISLHKQVDSAISITENINIIATAVECHMDLL